jgi:hypothetical protein
MDSDPMRLKSSRRIGGDRRSGADTRSASEKQLLGERRAGLDRRREQTAVQSIARPSGDQLAVFAKRLRRALASEQGRLFFGIAQSEYDFSIYPDVLRTLEWLETLTKADQEG